MSEVRRAASYYGSSATADGDSDKVITITKTIGNSIDDDYNISECKNSDILKTGTTIAIKFTDAETVTIKNYDTDGKEISDNDTNTVITDIKRFGRPLFLQFDDKDETAPKEDPYWKREIWINGSATAKDNPFGWSAGATVYFTYVHANDTEKDVGHWEVTDSGSYSNIT
jgi:hypothetical protein